MAGRRVTRRESEKDHTLALRIAAVVLVIAVLAVVGFGIGLVTGLVTLPSNTANISATQGDAADATSADAQSNLAASDKLDSDASGAGTDATGAAGTADASGTTTITISFAGDCTLGTDENFGYSGTFNEYYDGNGPDYFFSGVKDIFDADDLTVVNCEGVLTNLTTREDKQYAYKGKPEYAEIFSRGGVDCVGIWNNHTYDYGWESRADTIDALESANLVVFGDDLIGYTEVKGVKIALIAGNMLTTGLGEEDNVIPRIHEAQAQGAQIIIVQMHWGEMSVYEPTDEQIQLARDCIDAGATIVEGSHQHVLQGYEEYNGHYIVYGLGNFCYGGSVTLFDPDCYIFQQTFTLVDGIVQTADTSSINVIPCLISSNRSVNNYQPVVVDGDEKARVEGKIESCNAYIAAWQG